MQRASLSILCGLLARYAKPKEEKLLHFLSKEQRQEIAKIPHLEQEVLLPDVSFHTLINFVHYSWFLPMLKSASPKEKELFFQALGVEKKRKLKPWLNLPFSEFRLNNVARKFLQELLLSSLLGDQKDLMPTSFLFASPLNILIKLSKKELVLLIDLLGLYDLAHEKAKIVDPKLLKKMEDALSQKQQLFLKKNPNLKDIYPSQMFNLKDIQDPKKLRKKIHALGLYRLSRALAFESKDLIWYVSHILDMGRGLALQKMCTKEESLEVSKFISKQILFVIQTTLQEHTL